jgi:hypothetical protein
MRAFTYVAIALIAAAMSVPPVGAAFAQAGSIGGTVGNRDKSISGGEEEPRHHAVRKPPRRREQAARLGSFDGSWAGVSVALASSVGNSRSPMESFPETAPPDK